MTSIRHADGLLAAQALLLDLTVNPEASADRVALVLKMTKAPVVLATMAAKVFDQISAFPYVVGDIKLLAGEAVALEYGTALYNLNRMRVREGRTPLPIRFTDDGGSPLKIIHMSDYEHLRRKAA